MRCGAKNSYQRKFMCHSLKSNCNNNQGLIWSVCQYIPVLRIWSDEAFQVCYSSSKHILRCAVVRLGHCPIFYSYILCLWWVRTAGRTVQHMYPPLPQPCLCYLCGAWFCIVLFKKKKKQKACVSLENMLRSAFVALKCTSLHQYHITCCW